MAVIPLAIHIGIAVGVHFASKALAPKPKLNPVDRGRFDDIRITTAEEGGFKPLCFGRRVRLAGNIIWGTPTREYVTRDPGRTGGKGGSARQPTPPTSTYSYKKSFAILVCSTPVRSYRRISEDLEAIYNALGSEPRDDFYEAENHLLAGGAVAVEDGECSGGRAVRLSGSGHYVEIGATAHAAGLHTVVIFYKAASPAQVYLSANGGAETAVSLPATGDVPASVTATLSLARGSNNIKLRRNTGTSDVDRVYVSGTGVPDLDDPRIKGREVTNLIDINIPYPTDPDNPTPYYNTVMAFDADGHFEGYTGAGGQARFELFAGKETQPQSAIIVAVEGASETPAWRDDSYFVTEDYLLKEGRLGSFIFEIEPEIQDLDEILEYLYTLDGKVAAADCDFSALAGVKPDGFVLDHRAPLSEWVTALETWFNFDVVPRGGKVVAVPRGGAVVTRLYERELRAHLYGEERPRAAAKVTHEDPVDLPGAVDVLYLDPSPSKDFHAGNQPAEKTVGFAFDRETLSFPIVGDADTAHAVGLRFLDSLHLAAKPAELVCGFGKRHLIPTDIIEVEMEDTTLHTYRITRKEADLQGPVRFGVAPERPSIYTQTGAGVTGRGGDTLLIRPAANTLLVAADCVPVRQEDLGRLIIYAAACPRGLGSWPGYHLNKRDQNGEVERVGGFEAAATIGIVETASQSSAKFGLESARTFVVKLYHGSLESRTESEVRAERVNLALYGKGSRWEVIQFLAVTAQASSDPYVAQYQVTGVVSGLYGTEANSDNHQAGDYFVLFDGAVASFAMRAADVTQTFDFVGQTAGQALADAEAAGAQTLTFQGNSAKPLPPARVETDPETGRAPRDSAGSILVSAWPRANVEDIGDEYLIQFLTDDMSGVVHEMPMREGVATAALLQGFGGTAKFQTGISGNSLTRAGGVTMRAVSLQRILAADNFADATLSVTENLLNDAYFGLLREVPDPGAALPEVYVQMSNDTGTTSRVRVFADGVTVVERTGLPLSMRVRFLLSGTELRVYLGGESAAGYPAAYVSAAAPVYPLRAWARVGGTSLSATPSVSQIVMTTNPLPTTIFSAAQQQRYYGGLKNPVQVRIYQHSGVREAGYGQPWEGAI